MLDVGSNIKKLRELKGLTQENMAEELHMSVNGYGKIERGESDITVTRLEEISKVLGISISDILAFDEKVIFNNYENEVTQQYAKEVHIYSMPKELQQLYEDKIKLLEDKIELLKKK